MKVLEHTDWFVFMKEPPEDPEETGTPCDWGSCPEGFSQKEDNITCKECPANKVDKRMTYDQAREWWIKAQIDKETL